MSAEIPQPQVPRHEDERDEEQAEAELVDFADTYLVSNPALDNQTPEVAKHDISDMDTTPSDEVVEGPYQMGNIERAAWDTREAVDSGVESVSAGLHQRFESVKGFLSRNNLDSFEGLSDHGKKIATSAYETVYKIPGINKLVAKREIAWNQMWLDKREEKLAKIEEKASTLREKVADKQTNIDTATQLRELFSASDPGAAEKFAGQIAKQERSVATITAQLERNAALAKKQREGIGTLEAKRNAVAERMIGAYDDKIDSIKYQEALVMNEAFDFKEKVAEKERALVALEARLADKEALLVTAETLIAKQRGDARVDSEKIIMSIAHEIARTKEIIEHTRLKTQIEIRGFNDDVKRHEARRTPYEERQGFFKDVVNRRNSFSPAAEQAVSPVSSEVKPIESNETTPDSDTATLDTTEPVVPPTTSEDNPAEQSADSDLDDAVRGPEANELVETVRTISQFIKGWNSYVQSSTDASIPTLDRDRIIFNIDEKSFIDDARTPGFYSGATIAPNEMAGHMLGRLKRQIKASRSFNIAAEFEKKAEATVRRYFASIENT